jgi:hypothetical protein
MRAGVDGKEFTMIESSVAPTLRVVTIRAIEGEDIERVVWISRRVIVVLVAIDAGNSTHARMIEVGIVPAGHRMTAFAVGREPRARVIRLDDALEGGFMAIDACGARHEKSVRAGRRWRMAAVTAHAQVGPTQWKAAGPVHANLIIECGEARVSVALLALGAELSIVRVDMTVDAAAIEPRELEGSMTKPAVEICMAPLQS